MPNPSIAWTDGIGAAELVCQGLTFMNWSPDVTEVGETAVAPSSPAIHFFGYRTDNLLTFDIANIVTTDLALALRLKSQLVTGGSVTVHTRDAAGTVYTARVGPGTTPVMTLSDITELEYTLSLVLAWTAVSTEE